MSTKNDMLQDLAADYYVRELAADELAELQQGLKNDPALRDVFVNAGSEEWLMHRMHHTAVSKAIPFRPKWSRRIQRMAAGVAVLLTLGSLFVTQKVLRQPAGARVATVTDCFILPSDAITVVNDGKTRTVKQASALHSGDRVMLPPGSRLSFRYLEEDTTVKMGSGALFALSDLDGAKQIHLTLGQMSAEVAKQAPGKPMRIMTDDAEAVVLGTSFELKASDNTRLAVNTGCVRFNSPDANQSIEVPSGYLADSDENDAWKRLPFVVETLSPSDDRTIGTEKEKWFISVDHARNYSGYLKFDLGAMNAPLLEAKLRLRVMHKGSDTGGSGTVRLYSLPAGVSPDDPAANSRTQIAQYVGKVGAGMDLEFDINPAKLSEGINALMITQDKGGNDFWFSSSQGDVAPQLLLKTQAE